MKLNKKFILLECFGSNGFIILSFLLYVMKDKNNFLDF